MADRGGSFNARLILGTLAAIGLAWLCITVSFIFMLKDPGALGWGLVLGYAPALVCGLATALILHSFEGARHPTLTTAVIVGMALGVTGQTVGFFVTVWLKTGVLGGAELWFLAWSGTVAGGLGAMCGAFGYLVMGRPNHLLDPVERDDDDSPL